MMRKNVLVILGTFFTVGMLLAGCSNSSESGSAVREENPYVEGTQESVMQTESSGRFVCPVRGQGRSLYHASL